METKIKIMIVEDHPVNLKLAKDLLEMDGFEVISCTDAESAIALLKDLQPDMILMDVGLPCIDGLELTRILRADKKTTDIKIVAVTAFSMKSDKDKVLDAGCDGYISKPINTRTFATQIMEFLK